MLFNSLQFAIFLPVIFILNYISVVFIKKNLVTQTLLLLCSLFFYACWKPAYLLLILTSVTVTYFSGIFMEQFPKHKKLVLIFSLVLNLGILFVFKYFNFFAASIKWDFKINVLLPVGISFYTFQALSYSIDIYRKKITAERNFITYALFVTFFPQLVAGPIERTENLVPQFKAEQKIDPEKIKSGLKLIAWGLFEKIVIADRVAIYVNSIYNELQPVTGCATLLATVFFTFQVLCDFSGYSNIAIGTARILGFNLMRNFRAPFFSESMSELWNRWHISLSSWFKDYVYIPLGGSRCGKFRHSLNLLIIMTLCGLWHGAAWHFILWGFITGMILVFEVNSRHLTSRIPFIQKNENRLYFRILKIVKTNLWFFFIAVFFRANSVPEAFLALKKLLLIPSEIGIVLKAGGKFPVSSALRYLLFPYKDFDLYAVKLSGILLAIYLAVSFITQKEAGDILIKRFPVPVRWICYYAIVFALIFYSVTGKNQFVYFQF